MTTHARNHGIESVAESTISPRCQAAISEALANKYQENDPESGSPLQAVTASVWDETHEPGVSANNSLYEEQPTEQKELEYSVRLALRYLDTFFTEIEPDVGQAISKSLNEAVELLVKVAQGRSVSEPETIALRDLCISLSSLTAGLGLADPQTLMMFLGAYNLTPLNLETARKGTDGYRSTSCKVAWGSINYLGDQEEFYEDEPSKGPAYIEIPDDYYYPVNVEMQVTPGERVNFSFVQDLKPAQARYIQATRHKNSTLIREDLSIRFDKDPDSPTGFSLDIGRDPKDSDSLYRGGDLIGKILANSRPCGSHFYDHFSAVDDAAFDRFTRAMAAYVDAEMEHQRYQEYLRKAKKLGRSTRRLTSSLAV